MSEWPIAGARPVDRARDVARTCWDALHRVDPTAAAAIADAAVMAGEHWLTPQVARHDLHDFVSVPDAAKIAGRSPRWAYEWVAADRENRAHVGADGKIRVRLGEVLESVANDQRARSRKPAA